MAFRPSLTNCDVWKHKLHTDTTDLNVAPTFEFLHLAFAIELFIHECAVLTHHLDLEEPFLKVIGDLDMSSRNSSMPRTFRYSRRMNGNKWAFVW